jgi:serine/threonine protein kinase
MKFSVAAASSASKSKEESKVQDSVGRITFAALQAKGAGESPLPTISQKYAATIHLGSDRFAETFAGKNLSTGRPVTIKILTPPAGADELAVKAFRLEAGAVAHRNTRIDHHHVVRTFDYGLLPEDKRPYVVTEVLTGLSLAEYLKEEPRGDMDLLFVVRIAREITQGLWAAHRCGVIHHSLRPSVILLTRDYDGQLVAKIADFGYAKLWGRDNRGLNDLPQGARTVSVDPETYLAPEQLAGFQDADERTDIYNLGVLLREMLDGIPPSLPSKKESVSEHSELAPPPAASEKDVQSARHQLDFLVRQLLDEKPSHRPGTAAEVAQKLTDIENALSGGVGSVSPGPVEEASASASAHFAHNLSDAPPTRAGTNSRPESASVAPGKENDAPRLERRAEPGTLSLTALTAVSPELNSNEQTHSAPQRSSGEIPTTSPPEEVKRDLQPANYDESESIGRLAEERTMADPAKLNPPDRAPFTNRFFSVRLVALAIVFLAVILGAGLLLKTQELLVKSPTLPSTSAIASPPRSPSTEDFSRQTLTTNAKAPISDPPVENGAVADAGNKQSDTEKGEKAASAKSEPSAAQLAAPGPPTARGAQTDGRDTQKTASPGLADDAARQSSEGVPASVSSQSPSTTPKLSEQQINRCEISVSENPLILRTGGTAFVRVRSSDPAVKAGQIKGNTADWKDVVFFPERGTDEAATFSVVTVGQKEGTYKIRFAAPCGSKDLVVKVRQP